MNITIVTGFNVNNDNKVNAIEEATAQTKDSKQGKNNEALSLNIHVWNEQN